MGSAPAIKWSVLLSGGIDSALVLALLRNQKKDVTATWVDHGQAAAKAEAKASRRIAEHYSVPWAKVSASKIDITGGEIPGRNDLLVALGRRQNPGRSVAIGVHSGTPYADCSAGWVSAWNALLDAQTQGTTVLSAPLISMEKAEVISLARSIGVPLALTYSCEVANTPCLECLSCMDRKLLDARAE